jgi:hypothetical protein
MTNCNPTAEINMNMAQSSFLIDQNWVYLPAVKKGN